MAAQIGALRASVLGLIGTLEGAVTVLSSISAEVQRTRADLDGARTSMNTLASQGAASAASLVQSSTSARTQVEADNEAVRRGSFAVVGDVEKANASVLAASSSTSEAAGRTAVAVAQAAAEIEAQAPRVARMRELLDRMFAQGDAQLQSLQHRLEENETLWAQIINRMLEELELGLTDGTELLRHFGDALIATETGVVKLRDLLDDLEFDQYQQEVTDLANAVREGSASIADTIDFLRQKNTEWSRSLADLLQRILQGKATIEDLRRRAQQLEELFGAGPVTNLLEELARELQEDQNGGFN